MQIALPPSGAAARPAAAPAALSADIFPPELSEGESISARVIFCSGATAHLKTAAGAFMRARLEGGLTLSEGSEIVLTMLEKGDGLIKLRLSDILLTVEKAAPRQGAQLPPGAATDTRQSALPGGAGPASPAAPRPALGQLLQQLSALLKAEPAAAPLNAQATSTLPAVSLPQGALTAGPLAPLFELFLPQEAAAGNQPATSAEVLPAAGPLTATLAAAPPAERSEAGLTAQPLAEISAAELPLPPMPAATAREQASYAATRAGAEQPATVRTALPPATRRDLLEFSQRLVAELYPAGAAEPGLQELSAFVERLFLSGKRLAEKGGPALRQAARELTVRLELLKAVLEHTSLPQKAALLQEAHRLLRHSEALRAERPLCLQLPIQLAEQRQTAELYIYRRAQDTRPIDAQQATILLALNTEHLGRLQAFLQVRHKDIHLKLEIGRAAAVDFVKEQSAGLSKLLAAAGYRLASASVRQLSVTTSPQTAGAALEEFRQSFGQVDLKV